MPKYFKVVHYLCAPSAYAKATRKRETVNDEPTGNPELPSATCAVCMEAITYNWDQAAWVHTQPTEPTHTGYPVRTWEDWLPQYYSPRGGTCHYEDHVCFEPMALAPVHDGFGFLHCWFCLRHLPANAIANLDQWWAAGVDPNPAARQAAYMAIEYLKAGITELP